LTRTELIEETGLSPSTADHALQELVDAGAARRDAHPEDLRQRVYALADE